MEPMCDLGVEKFRENFDNLLISFRQFLSKRKNGTHTFSDGNRGDLEVILKINSLCSTKRGVSDSTPVVLMRQVGNPVEPNYNGLNPSAILFFDGDAVHSMLIFGGGVLNFKNIKTSSVCNALLNLLATYYVIDRDYAAAFSVLAIIDLKCLTKDNPRKKARVKIPTCLKDFLTLFNNFAVDEIAESLSLDNEDDDSVR